MFVLLVTALTSLADPFAGRLFANLAEAWPVFAVVAGVIWFSWPRGNRPARGAGPAMAIFAALSILWFFLSCREGAEGLGW